MRFHVIIYNSTSSTVDFVGRSMSVATTMIMVQFNQRRTCSTKRAATSNITKNVMFVTVIQNVTPEFFFWKCMEARPLKHRRLLPSIQPGILMPTMRFTMYVIRRCVIVSFPFDGKFLTSLRQQFCDFTQNLCHQTHVYGTFRRMCCVKLLCIIKRQKKNAC